MIVAKVVAKYGAMFQKYLSGQLSPAEFQSLYLKTFKDEKEFLDKELYDLLEEAFGAVECYTEDNFLLQGNSQIYVSEKQLKEKIAGYAKKLSRL